MPQATVCARMAHFHTAPRTHIHPQTPTPTDPHPSTPKHTHKPAMTLTCSHQGKAHQLGGVPAQPLPHRRARAAGGKEHPQQTGFQLTHQRFPTMRPRPCRRCICLSHSHRCAAHHLQTGVAMTRTVAAQTQRCELHRHHAAAKGRTFLPTHPAGCAGGKTPAPTMPPVPS